MALLLSPLAFIEGIGGPEMGFYAMAKLGEHHVGGVGQPPTPPARCSAAWPS
jgi:hypothetical protein